MKKKMKTFNILALGLCALTVGSGVYAQCEPVVAPCEPVQAVAEVKPCAPVATVEEAVAPCEPVTTKVEVPVYAPKPCEPVQCVEETVAPCEPVACVRDVPRKQRVVYVVHKPRFDWECDCGRGLRRGVVPGKDGKCRCWKCEHEIRVAEAKARRDANAERRRCVLDCVGVDEVSFFYKSVVEIKREVK